MSLFGVRHKPTLTVTRESDRTFEIQYETDTAHVDTKWNPNIQLCKLTASCLPWKGYITLFYLQVNFKTAGFVYIISRCAWPNGECPFISRCARPNGEYPIIFIVTFRKQSYIESGSLCP